MNFFLRIFTVLRTSIKKLYVSKKDYKDARYEIRKTNLNMLTVSSLMISVLFAVLFALSFLTINWILSKHKVYFLVFSLYTFLIFCLSVTILPRSKQYISTVMYLFLSILYFFGIIDSAFTSRTSYTVIFCVLQVACPIVVIDRTIRMFVFTFIWTALDMILIFIYKPTAIANTDYVHLIIFFILGIIMHMYLSSIKIREFILQQTIKTERDTDGLTGILNKSALSREIKKNLLKNFNEGILLIFDADDFKPINDNYGHDAGDLVLVEISKILTGTFRKTDIIGRFGGDEFIIFMTQTEDLHAAERKAEAALTQIRTLIIKDYPDIKVSGSFGIASCSAAGQNYEELFKRADKALYESKRNGKNRITINGDFNL